MGWLDPCQSISIRGPDSRHWTWTHIAPQIQTAIRYLDVTSSARQWIADLYNNVFRAEREVGLSGPQMSPPPVRAEWIQLEGRHGFGLSLSPASSRQVTAPDTDPDAYLPVHPGAAAYCNGTQQAASPPCWRRPGNSFGRPNLATVNKRWIRSMPSDAA